MGALDSMTADIMDIEQTAMQIQSELDGARSTTRFVPSIKSSTLSEAERITAKDEESRRRSQLADAEDIRRRMNSVTEYDNVNIGPTLRTSVQAPAKSPVKPSRVSIVRPSVARNVTVSYNEFDDADSSPLPSDSDYLFVTNVHSALTPVPLPPSPMRHAAAALNTRNVYDSRLQLPSAPMSGANDVARKADAERIMSAFRSQFRAANKTEMSR